MPASMGTAMLCDKCTAKYETTKPGVLDASMRIRSPGCTRRAHNSTAACRTWCASCRYESSVDSQINATASGLRRPWSSTAPTIVAGAVRSGVFTSRRRRATFDRRLPGAYPTDQLDDLPHRRKVLRHDLLDRDLQSEFVIDERNERGDGQRIHAPGGLKVGVGIQLGSLEVQRIRDGRQQSIRIRPADGGITTRTHWSYLAIRHATRPDTCQCPT